MTDDEMEELKDRLSEGIREHMENYDWDEAFKKYLEGL